MFKRLSAKKIAELDVGDRFARTAFLTYFLTFFLFPLVVVLFENTDFASSDGAGAFFVIIWLMGLKLAVSMFIPAMLVGAVVFFILHKAISVWTGVWFGAIISSAVAAYFSVLIAYHLNIDFFPPGLSWNAEYGSYSFSNYIGGLAAFISVMVAAITWIGVKHVK